MKFIIGKKIEMTQKFMEDGKVIPVTRVTAGPCFVTQKKENEKQGYRAVQLAWQEARAKRLNRPLVNFFKKALNKDIGYRFVREFRLQLKDPVFDKIKAGQQVDVSIFTEGDNVDIKGTSKGKGFQGVVKRHGFSGGPASHGHKDQLRMPGSIGATGPARVFRGTRMGGQLGNKSATVKNSTVVYVDIENNELWLKGAVPGARNGLILIQGPGEFEPIEVKEDVKPLERLNVEKPTEEKFEEVKVKVEEKKEEVKVEVVEAKVVANETAKEETAKKAE